MNRKRLAVLALSGVLAAASVAHAQFAVFDAANTLRNSITAELKAHIFSVLGDEALQLQRIAKRLSDFTDLRKFATHDVPEWRIHLFQFEQYLFANGFNASLNYGDHSGAGFEDVARTRVAPAEELSALSGEDDVAYQAIRAQLATLDAADSSIVIGADQNGQLRFNGRKEQAAIDALEADVADPSEAQSTAAVLDKISGAGLIRARQQQARIEFLTAITEQLLVESKRARDTEAATMNMQLERLRWGQASNASLIAGAADALRTWRMP